MTTVHTTKIIDNTQMARTEGNTHYVKLQIESTSDGVRYTLADIQPWDMIIIRGWKPNTDAVFVAAWAHGGTDDFSVEFVIDNHDSDPDQDGRIGKADGWQVIIFVTLDAALTTIKKVQAYGFDLEDEDEEDDDDDWDDEGEGEE